MKWLVLMFLAIVAVLASCSSPDCACNDGGQNFVGGGQTCTKEGSTAAGFAPVCSDIGGGTTTCTCTGGKWDCGKCPACGAITLGAQCGIGQVCSGPTTATQCDGTKSAVSGDCHCGGGWECDGVTAITCADAGTDASNDAAGD